ncbi:g11542 [Coccomyxa viridis]|uniref:GTP cyclohydrolase II n=1 Tax=Coccomyxa viridis TaxID=1274662 RepID=A0ABP1G9C7_9CHLO
MQGLGSTAPKQRLEADAAPQEPPFDCTEFVAETLLPTVSGKYRLRGYRHTFDGGRTYTEPSCIITGRPEGLENVPVRVHDACFTSEVLGSLKCDCAGQLQMAMGYIQEKSPGVIIYLQQEGRGIGLANKIAAYALQEEGLDTVDANRALGLPDDCREYSSVRNILSDLDIKSIRLMTNNPRKIQVLEELGVDVRGRIPCIVESQELNVGYLATKQARMQHWLSESDTDSLDGSFCYWNHDGEPLLPSAAQGGKSSGNGRLISRAD